MTMITTTAMNPNVCWRLLLFFGVLGSVVMIMFAADLADGVGPVDVINDAIYALGVVHALPRVHEVHLVSTRTPGEIAPTFCTFAPNVRAALRGRSTLVLPFGGDLIVRVPTCRGE